MIGDASSFRVCPAYAQGYDATAPVQQAYNASAAPAQQGYTAAGTSAQQQGYGQPAASVGLGVDQQSKLAQIIAQVRAAPP